MPAETSPRVHQAPALHERQPEPPLPEVPSEALTLESLAGSIRRALVLGHSMDAHRTQETFRNAVDVTALIELLISKRVIGLSELDDARQHVTEQITAQRAKAWIGPTLYPSGGPETNEPVLVDCTSRYVECKAACCTMYNVFLTSEEVRDGRFLWEMAEPYRLPRQPDGSCFYLDTETLRCRTWQNRPHVCRRYSCSTDKNVWENFEKHIVSEKQLRYQARRLAEEGVKK